MAFPKVKISDDSGNTVGVDTSSNSLNVKLVESIDVGTIGDVSLLLGGTAASTNADTMDDQTLRVTLATDDTHWGTVGTGADSDGTAHAQLRYIAISLFNLLNYSYYSFDADYDSSLATDMHLLVGGVRNDTPLSITDGDTGPIRVGEEGEVIIDVVDGGILESALDGIESGLVTLFQELLNLTSNNTQRITGMQSDQNPGVDWVTAEVLKSSTACKRVDMQADSSNTGYIYVGGSDVSATKGIRLAPGDFYSIDIDNTADIYVLASVDQENIFFTYFT